MLSKTVLIRNTKNFHDYLLWLKINSLFLNPLKEEHPSLKKKLSTKQNASLMNNRILFQMIAYKKTSTVFLSRQNSKNTFVVSSYKNKTSSKIKFVGSNII